jgi:hypothetical protein
MAIHAWTLILKIKISTPIGFIAAQKILDYEQKQR